jgi:hypothetical protein
LPSCPLYAQHLKSKKDFQQNTAYI